MLTGEIGYALLSQYSGQGIMTRAVACIVEYGLGSLCLSRITAAVDNDNAASRRVLEKAGFRRSGQPPEREKDRLRNRIAFEISPDKSTLAS